MTDLAAVQALAEALLDQQPDPIPRYRLLRDVLHLPADDRRLIDCQREVLKSPAVAELAVDQLPNGSWGRFHSQDSTKRQRFRTSELAIQRALAVGLDKDTAILQRAIGYMERHLGGQETWSDPAEKHEGWPVNVRFITGGTLARIDRDHPLLADLRSLWVEILQRTFQSGSFDAEAERQAHRDLNGIHTKGKYLRLSMVYPLLILSATRRRLPVDLEAALLSWLWRREGGMYYVYGGCLSTFPPIGTREFPRWLNALDVIANFPTGRTVAGDAIAWLWAQRSADGWWDFGAAGRDEPTLPLSSSWRQPPARQIDSSVRVLTLLHRYYAAD